MSLKERIAALQHREDAGSRAAAAAAAPAGHGGPNTTALRAKIAQFESKGAVPVPRGSFGMGAPPESGPPRRAELYGNRMRPSPAAVLERRDISPFAALEDDALPKDMRALTPQHTGPEHKPTVVARGTAFNTALDIARKAEADVQSHAEKREKRRSGAWLTPQFTGGGSTLVPQYTGGSFTSSSLTPQHTGSSALMPQYTGSNPSSPPLSPLVPYSHSWSPRSPTFRETLPKSPTMPVTEEPEEQPLTLTEEPEEQPLTLTDVDSIEPVADNWKGPEPSALPSSPLEEVMESPKVQEQFDEEETGPSVDEADAESIHDDVLDQRIHDVPSDVVVVPPTSPSPSTPNPTPDPAQDPRNLNSEDIPAEPELEPDSPDSFHAGFEPESPDSFHAGFDPQQYVLYPASTSSTPLSYSYDLNMSTTAYAARNRHLSTITERSAEPGSPGWDAEASRRYSMMSIQAQVLDEYDELEAEAGGGQSTPRGEEEAELKEPAGPGRAGVGAGWGGRPVEFGAGMGTGARVLGGVVEERDEEEARAPSPSPYRLSGLTERGYTPSLRSEGSVRSFRELPEDSEGGRDGDGDEAEEGGEGEEPEEKEPPTPMANAQASLTSEPVETEAAPPTTTSHPQTGHNRDLLLPPQQDGDDSLSSSQRDSLLSLSLSQRDSLFSSQRDSLSSLSSQTLRVRPRPLSALSALDSGSPSHVALAHRIPVFDAIGAVGVAGAEQVFVSAGSGLTPTRDAPPTPTPVTPEAAAPIRRALSAGATAPSARALPTPPAPPPATSLPTTPHQAAAQAPPDAPRTPPRRHGYTTGAPRPHTTYVPPAPDPEEELYRGVGEFGTISFGGGVPQSFSAVVHGRVREGSASSSGRGRSGSSPDAGGGGEYEKDKRLPLPPMPMSPGYASAELAELLAEAAALEVRLERGELPGEALRRMSMRPPPPSSEPQAPMPPLPPVPEAAKSGGAKALKPQRSFRNPLARSRSDRRPEQKTEVRPAATSSSSTGNLLNLRIQNPGPPEAEDVQLSRPMSSPTSSIPPTPPPKSPGYGGGTRYFSSLRRLASTTRTLGLAGTDGRGSLSTSSELSSEDSMLVTPPDDGAMSVGHNVAWPTISPKKSAGSIGRSAASLAGRVFHRSRTKSSTSTASSFDAPSPPPVPHPPLPSPPSLKLDSTQFFIPAIQTSLHEEDHVESPATSTPVANPYTSPTTAKPKSSTPPTRPPHLVLNQPAPGGESLLKASNVSPTHESRPSSMMSNISSVTSSSATQSPLFDNAIFDAFPSVPQMTPPNVSGHLRAGPLSAGTTRGGGSGELLGRLAETHQRVDALL